MSRTDKDKPWPLRAAEHQSGSYIRHLCGNGVACDIDRDPYEAFKNAYNRQSARHHRVWKLPNCGPVMSHHALSGVPAWYIGHVWNNVERVRERDDLRALAREYNSNNDIQDGDFPCWQHRHMASWRYW
jgi:hypothetical protein